MKKSHKDKCGPYNRKSWVIVLIECITSNFISVILENLLIEAGKTATKNLQEVFFMHESWDFILPVGQTDISFSLETKIGYHMIMDLSLVLWVIVSLWKDLNRKMASFTACALRLSQGDERWMKIRTKEWSSMTLRCMVSSEISVYDKNMKTQVQLIIFQLFHQLAM